MATRLSALLRRSTGRTHPVRGLVTFNEATGEVCDAACRINARLGQARTSALVAGFGRI